MLSRTLVGFRSGVTRLSFNNTAVNNVGKSRPNVILVRNFGITDSLVNMATKRVEKGREKQFGEMMDLMIASPKWTLRPWRKSMEGQLDSWSMYIPGVSSSSEVQQIKIFKEMMDSMTDEELDHPELINNAARERIARASGKSVDDVGKLIMFYKQSLIIATWLQQRKALNEKLPSSEPEMFELQEQDPKIKTIAAKVMQPKRKKSGRGMRLPF